jgi:hypothetical protein
MMEQLKNKSPMVERFGNFNFSLIENCRNGRSGKILQLEWQENDQQKAARQHYMLGMMWPGFCRQMGVLGPKPSPSQGLS